MTQIIPTAMRSARLASRNLLAETNACRRRPNALAAAASAPSRQALLLRRGVYSSSRAAKPTSPTSSYRKPSSYSFRSSTSSSSSSSSSSRGNGKTVSPTVNNAVSNTFPDPQPAATPRANAADYAGAGGSGGDKPGFGLVPDPPATIPSPFGSPAYQGQGQGGEAGNSNSADPSDPIAGGQQQQPGGGAAAIDWASSFHGLGQTPFAPETAAVLMRPLPFEDVEIKPDGIIYLPEIKYRRILNTAFGPGGWGMAPRGEMHVGDKVVTREYVLVVHGRFIAMARGECAYFSDDSIATAGEGCKSNALLRCCKDLGIASELWDPRYIREFKRRFASEIWVEHVVTKKKRLTWVRKGDEPVYPFKKS